MVLEGINDTLQNGTKLWHFILLVRVMDTDLSAWREALGSEHPSIADYLLGIATTKSAKNCDDSTFVSFQALEMLRHIQPLGDPGRETIYLLTSASLFNQVEGKNIIRLSQEEVLKLRYSIPFGWIFEHSLWVLSGYTIPTGEVVEIPKDKFLGILREVRRRTHFVFTGDP